MGVCTRASKTSWLFPPSLEFFLVLACDVSVSYTFPIDGAVSYWRLVVTMALSHLPVSDIYNPLPNVC